jgi:3-isopropylmalate dehydrogenase
MRDTVVVVIPGDGIGPIVTAQAVRVLEAVGFRARFVEAEAGWGCWLEQGTSLPDRTVALVDRHRLCLFGAITSAPRSEIEAESRSSGIDSYRSPILELRRRFSLDVSVRPCRSFPGNPRNHVRREPDGSIVEPEIDLVVFRQNTEGLYSGVEWGSPSRRIRRAFRSHPGYQPFLEASEDDLAITARIVSRAASRRLLEAAFDHAASRGLGEVIVCEKPNVLRETSGLFIEVAGDVADRHGGIALRIVNIDAFLMQLVLRPDEIGVVATTNLFGDLISEAAAGLVGGLGFAPSANLGEQVALFEPAHGSAPHRAGYPVAVVNPIAAILSAAMLLDHVGEADRAESIRRAVAGVVSEGRIRTYDMLGIEAGPAALEGGAASTEAMTDAIITRLR